MNKGGMSEGGISEGRVLSPGEARGALICLDEPLSFWGGVDSETGLIIDQSHPQVGQNIATKVLVMERGRGSSSGSSVLAEAIRAGTGPAGIVLAVDDEIIALGAIVADEIYGIQMPVVVLDPAVHASLCQDEREVVGSVDIGVLAPMTGPAIVRILP